jgi:TDG/mug DNA glycosylase family protein
MEEAMPVLEDVLQPGLRIVFCGSAVGSASAARQAYYAGRGNQFWPVLLRTGLTSRLLIPEEYRSLTEFGIGLTDINKTEYGSDRMLTKSASDGPCLQTKILQYAPKVLAFNGKRSAQAYLNCKSPPFGLHPQTIGSTQIFVLPSTSGAARGFWDESHWQALAHLTT